MTAIDRPHPVMSEAEADQRLGRNRRDTVAMLAKADCRMLAGDHRAANAYYGQVIRLADEGIPSASQDIVRARAAMQWLAEQFRLSILDGLAARGIDRAAMHPRFAKSLAIMFGERQRDPSRERFPQLPNMYYYPDLPHIEFTDPAEHDWVPLIEEHAGSILSEAQALLERGEGFGPYVKAAKDRPQGDVHGMLEDPSWSTLDLTERGIAVPEHIALAPTAWAATSANAPLCDIPNRAPSVMFSLLRVGSRIPPHTGMINARLICHLPLIVPGNGALRVGNSEKPWEYGKIMMFDDTVEHEAWNNAPRDRLVLIFDIWRPEVSLEERAQIRALFETVDSY